MPKETVKTAAKAVKDEELDAPAKKRVAKKVAAKPAETGKRPKTTEEGYKIYYPDAKRDAYSKGEIIFFERVRNWMQRGELVEAYGKVVALDLFDGDVPYIEVSFADAKKLNKVDLGDDVRRFILESK
ncbi:MAG: hypothetical protein HRF49_07225 [bacterium]|jgi:hypothetical protein